MGKGRGRWGSFPHCASPSVVLGFWFYAGDSEMKTALNKPSLFSSRDRLRGIVNIMGDSYGAAIVEHLSRDDLLLTDFESRDPKDE